MAQYKVAMTKNSKARTKHTTYELAEKSRSKIPQPNRYNYSIFKWNKKENRWE